MKINEMEGHEHLPQKKDVSNASIDIFRAPNRGYNQCIKDLHSIELRGDVEKLAKVLEDANWRTEENLAKEIIAAMPSWVRLVKGEK